MGLPTIFRKKSAKKLVVKAAVYWLVLVIPFLALTQPTLAQAKPTTTTPTNQTLYYYDTQSQQYLPTGTKALAATTSATTEKGQVLGCGGWCPDISIPNPLNLLDLIPGVSTATNVLDAVKDVFHLLVQLPLNIAKEILNWVFENLLQALARIILYTLHIFASSLGFNPKRACDGITPDPNVPDDTKANCLKSLNVLAKIDPLFADTSGVSSSFNLFTFVDASNASLYQSFTGNNTIRYVADAVNESVLGAQDTRAQGRGTQLIGFGAVKTAWAHLRDLAYVAMVLILVIIGFMVMFRKRLDPRTVVTATNSLPKVAVALILITFSFAIAGLFFDLIFLLDNAVRVWFSDLNGGWTQFWGLLGTKGFKFISAKAGGEYVWLPFFTMFSQSIIKPTFLLAIAGASGLAGAVVPGFGVIVAALLGYIIAIIGYMIFEIVIRLSMFIIAVVLFWTLFMRYVTMIALAIFGPVFFLIGAVPGFESLTVSWLKRMLANAIVFPVTLVFVYLAVSFLAQDGMSLFRTVVPLGGAIVDVGSVLNLSWTPSTGGAPPGLGGGSFFLNIQALIGVGFILFAIKVPGFIDEVFGLKDPFGRSGIGAGLLFAAGALPFAAANKAGSAFKTYSSISGGLGAYSGSKLPFAAQVGGFGQRFFGSNVRGGGRRSGPTSGSGPTGFTSTGGFGGGSTWFGGGGPTGGPGTPPPPPPPPPGPGSGPSGSSSTGGGSGSSSGRSSSGGAGGTSWFGGGSSGGSSGGASSGGSSSAGGRTGGSAGAGGSSGGGRGAGGSAGGFGGSSGPSGGFGGASGGSSAVDGLYSKFDLKRGVSKQEFNRRYIQYMATYHPDKNPDDIAGATRKTAELNDAKDRIFKAEGWS